jgi:hypothetical protein
MDFVVRLHRYHRFKGLPYRIGFVPDPICWTEAPVDLKTLRNQRIRWQRGLCESIVQSPDLLFNPKASRTTHHHYSTSASSSTKKPNLNKKIQEDFLMRQPYLFQVDFLVRQQGFHAASRREIVLVQPIESTRKLITDDVIKADVLGNWPYVTEDSACS